MSGIFQRALELIVGDSSRAALTQIPKDRHFKQITERDLIRLESEIGSQIFGALPHGHRREFFCLDSTTWIWYEEWYDENRRFQTSTIRYEINQNGVLKVQEGARYSYLDGQEYEHFAMAMKMYFEQVMRRVYGRYPASGELITPVIA